MLYIKLKLRKTKWPKLMKIKAWTFYIFKFLLFHILNS